MSLTILKQLFKRLVKKINILNPVNQLIDYDIFTSANPIKSFKQILNQDHSDSKSNI